MGSIEEREREGEGGIQSAKHEREGGGGWPSSSRFKRDRDRSSDLRKDANNPRDSYDHFVFL